MHLRKLSQMEGIRTFHIFTIERSFYIGVILSTGGKHLNYSLYDQKHCDIA